MQDEQTFPVKANFGIITNGGGRVLAQHPFGRAVLGGAQPALAAFKEGSVEHRAEPPNRMPEISCGFRNHRITRFGMERTLELMSFHTLP